LVGCAALDEEQDTESQGVQRQDSAVPNRNPGPANADNCYPLGGTWHNTVDAATGAGSCAVAQAGLFSFVASYADCSFEGDLCSLSLVITQPCFSNAPGNWQVGGYARYRCVERPEGIASPL
jgi:hypothetical protein